MLYSVSMRVFNFLYLSQYMPVTWQKQLWSGLFEMIVAESFSLLLNIFIKFRVKVLGNAVSTCECITRIRECIYFMNCVHPFGVYVIVANNFAVIVLLLLIADRSRRWSGGGA